ncbi:hypothetical protein COEREDRAFT_80537 [Coemansia reversa NRRL 1564]|uniref:Uncharacterized protein n=1 Tax=Coemansia reversa (strain ATCC 12441 / NRRL 1564) TaxID=763665 RepID=A0A2G5BFR1_COERN|nr:hypothetical protein COEREDRAFT_80537 [Coemansia reversa NRRL 1564]|eukprot:PIA17557.1 hypothetical protein COEREDRAFT_80537 [Coemansia reversa NRRL 1564]
MKFVSFIFLLTALLFAVVAMSAPVPSPATANDCVNECMQQAQASSLDQGTIAQLSRRQNEPVLPLPAPGETLFSYLDRLLSNLPLLGNLLEGLGYVRPK